MPAVTTHFEGRFLSLQSVDDWEFVTRSNSTAVVGILAITDANEFVLVEQYRPPLQARVLEICAGLVGDEPEFADESLTETARRELLEETGYEAQKIKLLMSSPTSAGMTDEITHLFLAMGLKKTGTGGGVAGEEIKTHLVPHADLAQFLKAKETEGVMIDFKIHAALSAMHLESGASL